MLGLTRRALNRLLKPYTNELLVLTYNMLSDNEKNLYNNDVKYYIECVLNKLKSNL